MAKRFSVVINKSWCKGCSLCVGICPKKVLKLDDQVKCELIGAGDCMGCRQCENICPDFAITVKESE
ncbi:MAG: 4Fe-4S binding protein [Synergistaceae bacterium]|nr:4Fe-4S binding protein [Synergistaceae bacterium]